MRVFYQLRTAGLPYDLMHALEPIPLGVWHTRLIRDGEGVDFGDGCVGDPLCVRCTGNDQLRNSGLEGEPHLDRQGSTKTQEWVQTKHHIVFL